MIVHVTQRVISTCPGRVGNWALTDKMQLPIVPRTGDQIEILIPSGGEHTAVVKHITLRSEQPPLVELHPVTTNSPDALDELDDRQWEQHGGPWKGQQQ